VCAVKCHAEDSLVEALRAATLGELSAARRGPWAPIEDALVLDAAIVLQHQWRIIAERCFGGRRSHAMIRNRAAYLKCLPRERRCPRTGAVRRTCSCCNLPGGAIQPPLPEPVPILETLVPTMVNQPLQMWLNGLPQAPPPLSELFAAVRGDGVG